jgi:hypothetical protein
LLCSYQLTVPVRDKRKKACGHGESESLLRVTRSTHHRQHRRAIICGESVIKQIRKKLAKSSAFSLDPAHGLLHIWIIESALGDSSERFIYSTEKR